MVVATTAPYSVSRLILAANIPALGLTMRGSGHKGTAPTALELRAETALKLAGYTGLTKLAGLRKNAICRGGSGAV